MYIRSMASLRYIAAEKTEMKHTSRRIQYKREVLDTKDNTPFHYITQWSLSIVDTIGTQLAVLYREVSLFQR